MASFFKSIRRSQILPDYHQEPHRHFYENQCRVLGDQVAIAKEISSDHTLCPRSALPELQRVVKLGETLSEGCQNETCHRAYLRQDERTKAFEETLKEILWCISVVFNSNKRRLSGNPSVLAADEFPQAILGAKEQYVLQKAALSDDKLLKASLDIWIEKHECSPEECGRPQRQPGALCLAAQILDRRASNSEGPASRGLVDDVEADLKSSLWITVQNVLEDVGQIGKGSFGTVFETKWLGDTYAKKEFDTRCRDFADEANALAKLNHPHIVKVYTACSESCIPCFFLMEKMPDNLRTHMNWRMNRLGMNPPFSISAGIDLMLQLSEAMSYMNSQEMVHRDLKAANILVKPVDPEICGGFVIAKLADFGLAKVKHEVTSRMTRNTGTRLWMAPEVFGAHTENEEQLLLEVFPRKADIYSFGIVCSEILTGNVPFHNVSYKPRELYKLITEPGNPLRPELPHSCPESLASLIRECWHTDPVIRPTFKEISMTLRYFKGLLMMAGGAELVQFESASWRSLRAIPGTPCSTNMVQTQGTLGNNTAETKIASARDEIAESKEKLHRDWLEKLLKLEQENAVLHNKLQLDVVSGRAFLLKTNATQEAELRKLRDGTKQHDAELLRLKDETNKKEAELMKLTRDKTDKLLDEITHMVDEKENALLSIQHLEEEKRKLEELLKGESDGFMKQVLELTKKVEVLEKARVQLCNELDIMENAQMSEQMLIVVEVEGLEKESEQLRNKLEILDKDIVRLEGIIDEKDVQLEKANIEVLAKKRLEREIKGLKIELSKDKAEIGAEDNESAQAEYRSKIEKLKEQVSTLTSAKSTLETQVAESETKINENERLLDATQELLKALNEEQKRDFETAAKGLEPVSEEKTVLEGKLATLQEENAQMSEQISELTVLVENLEKEKEQLCNELDIYDKEIIKLEGIIDEKDAELEKADVEVLAKKRLEREIKGLKLELSKDKAEMERLQAELDEISKIGQEGSLKIIDLEEARDELEARSAALMEDKKRASVKASELGEEILKLETECKELKQGFGELNTKYLEIAAERDELQQGNRHLRNK